MGKAKPTTKTQAYNSGNRPMLIGIEHYGLAKGTHQIGQVGLPDSGGFKVRDCLKQRFTWPPGYWVDQQDAAVRDDHPAKN